MKKSLLLALVFALIAAVVVPLFVSTCASPVDNQCGTNASTIASYVWSQLAGPEKNAFFMRLLVFRIFLLAFLVSYALLWLGGRLRNRTTDT